MSKTKPGIAVVEEIVGTGPIVDNHQRVHILYDIQLNRGDFLARDERLTFRLNERGVIPGFRYGIEGMRVGGTRKFKASPHLCYAGKHVENLPEHAVLVVTIKSLELAKEQ
ncbi:MAG: FKBP-type peptidyl-prolyl cis-trans isomerase [Planctomycetota bacterium]